MRTGLLLRRKDGDANGRGREEKMTLGWLDSVSRSEGEGIIGGGGGGGGGHVPPSGMAANVNVLFVRRPHKKVGQR